MKSPPSVSGRRASCRSWRLTEAHDSGTGQRARWSGIDPLPEIHDLSGEGRDQPNQEAADGFPEPPGALKAGPVVVHQVGHEALCIASRHFAGERGEESEKSQTVARSRPTPYRPIGALASGRHHAQDGRRQLAAARRPVARHQRSRRLRMSRPMRRPTVGPTSGWAASPLAHGAAIAHARPR